MQTLFGATHGKPWFGGAMQIILVVPCKRIQTPSRLDPRPSRSSPAHVDEFWTSQARLEDELNGPKSTPTAQNRRRGGSNAGGEVELLATKTAQNPDAREEEIDAA